MLNVTPIKRAMILAAGRGERMRPLTDKTPKPLLQVAGKPLIEYHLEALAGAGMEEVFINHAHLGEQIPRALGDGSRWGLKLTYSAEPPGALETGGGIFRVMDKLGVDPLLVINGDVWLRGFNFAAFNFPESSASHLAHLLLILNPGHNPAGDFKLKNGAITNGKEEDCRLTFSGLGVYRLELFTGCSHGSFPLTPLLRRAANQGLVSGECFNGDWMDVGTPERLAQLDQRIRRLSSTETGSGH